MNIILPVVPLRDASTVRLLANVRTKYLVRTVHTWDFVVAYEVSVKY